MAYTLAEVQAVLANLKATYLLTTKLNSQFAQRGRDVTYVELAKVRAEIEQWEARGTAAGGAKRRGGRRRSVCELPAAVVRLCGVAAGRRPWVGGWVTGYFFIAARSVGHYHDAAAWVLHRRDSKRWECKVVGAAVSGGRSGTDGLSTERDTMRGKTLVVWAFTACCAGLTGRSLGQWTTVDLHPTNVGSGITTQAFGVDGGRQVGQLQPYAPYASPQFWATVWTGSSDSRRSLPAESSYASSVATGVQGTQTVGYITNSTATIQYAYLWNGTDSWVNLSPTTWSAANGVDAGQQVGYAGGSAALWSGTAESLVNLNPAGSAGSEAKAIHAGQQVGWAWMATEAGQQRHAGSWTGTAASWTDLNPAGVSQSQANGVYSGRQVGYALIGGQKHASTWNGTAGTWVDLNPAGALLSEALGVAGNRAVGYAQFSYNTNRAVLWNLDTGGWEDLGQAFPAFEESTATAAWTDGASLYVVGQGKDWDINERHALMWSGSVPEPGALSLLAILSAAALARRRRKGRLL